MCGRFNIIDDPLTQLLVEIAGVSLRIETRYNIAPTEQVPVLVQDESGWNLLDMRWWLVPHWAKEPSTKYSMFNAKSETLAKSSAFRDPFKKRRCIIPASGYYEWKKEGGVKIPYYLEPAEDTGFAFAGLWDRWRSGDQVIESCTIVTAVAPAAMTGVHHRIPVHLSREEIKAWVDNDTPAAELASILRPEIRGPVRITPMSTYVNNARNKDDRCIEPLGESRIVMPDDPPF